MRRTFLTFAAFLTIVSSHAIAECPPRPVVVLPLIPAQRPMVQALINGEPFKMAVDTGAQGTSVTPETAARLQLRRDPRHRTVSRERSSS